jgi:hypothetical protein
VKCASCGEFNSRLERECGECGAPLDVALVEVDKYERKRAEAAEQAAPPRPHRLPATRSQRIAGWVLSLNAIFAAFTVLRAESTVVLVSLGIDVVIGVSLARGSRRLVPFLLFRLAMGVLFGLASGISTSFALATVGFCAGVAVLVIGEPGPPRRLLAAGAIGASLFLRFQSLVVTRDVVEEALHPAAKPSLPEGPQTGAALAYTVDLPYGWRRGAARENEDAAFIQNRGNAGVIVSFEESEEVAMDAAFQNYTEAMAEYDARLLGVEDIDGQTDRRRLGRLKWTFQGEEVEAFVGLHAGGKHQFLVRATCTKCDDVLRGELRKIACSLRLPPDEPELPANVESTPVTRIEVPDTGYSLALPRGWYQRKQDEPTNHAHFLTRVYRDVHLFVDLFPRGAPVSVNKLLDVQLDAMEEQGDLDGFERKPWPGHERAGRVLSGGWNRDEGKLSVKLAAVGGKRPFVVMVFAEGRAFEALKSEIDQIIASLQRADGP